MALRDHVTPRIVVPLLGDNSVAVRGLNLDDFTFLLGEHLESVSKIAELYTAHKNSIFTAKPFQEFILAIAKDFPGVVSEVISIAADEPDVKDVRLGMGLQIGVLNAVIKLTMEEAGGLGNLFAQIRGIGAGLPPAAAQGEKQSRSPASSGYGENR
jgi:hypothetical protein